MTFSIETTSTETGIKEKIETEIEEQLSPDEELMAIREYFDAHELLPRGSVSETEICRYVAVLRNGMSGRDEHIHALITLAHAGRQSALDALVAYAQTPLPGLGLFAELALEECELWCAEETPLPAPSPLRRQQNAHNEPCFCGSGKKRKRCCDKAA